MCRMGSLLLAGLLGVALAASAPAQDAGAPGSNPGDVPYTLDADEVTYDPDRDLYEAIGNVRVVQEGGRTLTADWLVFNRITQVGVAMGNVRIVDRQDVVEAEFTAIDLRSLVALASNASVDTPQPGVSIEGESLRRTGVNTFEVENGRFTTCRCVPDTQRRPWEIQVEDADVTVGGYAVARNLWFKVWDVPVLYAPWVIFPVKTERQSGLLMPSIASTSRGGTEIEVPFFKTLGDQAGAILRPTFMSKRACSGSRDNTSSLSRCLARNTRNRRGSKAPASAPTSVPG